MCAFMPSDSNDATTREILAFARTALAAMSDPDLRAVALVYEGLTRNPDGSVRSPDAVMVEVDHCVAGAFTIATPFTRKRSWLLKRTMILSNDVTVTPGSPIRFGASGRSRVVSELIVDHLRVQYGGVKALADVTLRRAARDRRRAHRAQRRGQDDVHQRGYGRGAAGRRFGTSRRRAARRGNPSTASPVRASRARIRTSGSSARSALRRTSARGRSRVARASPMPTSSRCSNVRA